jgi:hypothetical protein
MSLEVVTNDALALTDSDLDEMASMGGAFDIGTLSKAKEDWVLVATARIDGKLHGFSFSTLERIGGTPCVLIGHDERAPALQARPGAAAGLMGEAYHRALMAFPDEDVVVGSRFVDAGAVDAFKDLDDVTPSPGTRAVGEERAWGRRLAKRFDVDANYDEKSFVVSRDGQDGFLDFETSKPEKVPPTEFAEMFAKVPVAKGGALDRLRLDHGRGSRQARSALSPWAEFVDVVRRRRMTRAFDGRPVRPDRHLRHRRSRLASSQCRQGPGLAPRGAAAATRPAQLLGHHLARHDAPSTFKWQRLLDAPADRAAVRRPEGLHRPVLRTRQGGHRSRRQAPRPGLRRTGRSTRRWR